MDGLRTTFFTKDMVHGSGDDTLRETLACQRARIKSRDRWTGVMAATAAGAIPLVARLGK